MRVKDLTKQYDGKTVVDSVSFEIPKGKVISMIGPNGAGKSTVLNIISRLIARDSGLVDFDGRDIGKWKSKELAKRLAILTQSNNIQMKLTVRELVTFGRFPYSGSHLNEEDQRIIDKAIAYMELEPFQDGSLTSSPAASASGPISPWSSPRTPSLSFWTSPPTTWTSITPPT